MAEDRGPEVEATAILFLVLAWVLVSLRCYVRGFLLRSFGLDDTLCVVALVSRCISILSNSILGPSKWPAQLVDAISSFNRGSAMGYDMTNDPESA
jgi:hypothetical protein